MDSDVIWQDVMVRLRLYFGQIFDLELMADAIGVANSTVVSWLADEYRAKGEKLITIWHLLEALGFESPEMDDLPRFNRYLGELFTFTVISLDEVKELCDVTDSQTALRILRGQPPMHPALNFKELQTMYDEQLQEKKQIKLQRLPRFSDPPSQQDHPSQAPTQQNDIPIVTPIAQAISGDDRGVLLAAVALGQVLPIVRHLVSDACTPADRNRVRELLGEGAMFELSNYFESLCSERARKLK